MFRRARAVVEPEPERAFAIAQGVVHGVGRQPVCAADVLHLPACGINRDESGAQGHDAERPIGECDPSIELRVRQCGCRCRERRQRGAVVEEQSVLARADQQPALVIAQEDDEGLVAERGRARQGPQRGALQHVQPASGVGMYTRPSTSRGTTEPVGAWRTASFSCAHTKVARTV